MMRTRVVLVLVGVLWPMGGFAQTPEVVEYYHPDALGSVRVVTTVVNGQVQVVSRHDFLPFGEELEPNLPPPDRRLFTGKERDFETALDYFSARYYRPSVGRFATVDPLMESELSTADPRRWNRYSYAGGNPLKYVDPNGLSYILYNRAEQKLYLFDKDGKLVGTYDAANNVTSGSYELRDGAYPFRDRKKPTVLDPEDDPRFTEDGSLGTYGIFTLKEFMGADNRMHWGIGIHSGRKLQGGCQHLTNGCVRTTDQAMEAIKNLAKNDPLTDLIVQNYGSVLVVRKLTISFVFFPGLAFPVPVITSVAASQ